METIGHDPNKLKTPEVKEKLRQVRSLIKAYHNFDASIRDMEKFYTRLNDPVRMDGIETRYIPVSSSGGAEQEGMRQFRQNLDIVAKDIADITGQEPLFKFDFMDPIGDMARMRGFRVDPEERSFIAREIQPGSKGSIRLIGLREGEEVVVPADTNFIIELERADAPANY